MCPALLRVFFVPCVLCFLVLLLQQRCLSAALKPSPSSALLRHHDDDDDVEEVAQDVVRVEGRDRNSSRGREPLEDRLDRHIAAMEGRIRQLEGQVLELKAFASKQQREKCAHALCPVGAMKHGCHCLLYVNRSHSWAKARDYCASMTGRLVTVSSDGVQKHIKNFLKAQLGRQGVSEVEVLTGLIYTTQASKRPSYMGDNAVNHGGADGWYWHNLLNVTKVHPAEDFTNWAPGHPATNKTDVSFPPSCMHLEGKQRLQWVTTHCHRPKTFICHFNAVPTHGRDRNRKRKKKKKKERRTRHQGKRHRGGGRKRRQGGRRNRDQEERENG
ncbi:uncharacterized protein LOC143281943 [Babylonia areolata]|uniref:uncharacterized protein LOC143281943 n=1 Tax=Babylonia areolata TaxID=304850 RepID=UPI003FD1E7BF